VPIVLAQFSHPLLLPTLDLKRLIRPPSLINHGTCLGAHEKGLKQRFELLGYFWLTCLVSKPAISGKMGPKRS
jgi:hypothetical protein